MPHSRAKQRRSATTACTATSRHDWRHRSPREAESAAAAESRRSRSSRADRPACSGPAPDRACSSPVRRYGERRLLDKPVTAAAPLRLTVGSHRTGGKWRSFPLNRRRTPKNAGLAARSGAGAAWSDSSTARNSMIRRAARRAKVAGGDARIPFLQAMSVVSHTSPLCGRRGSAPYKAP